MTFIIQDVREGKNGNKEYLLQSKRNPELFNWISSEKLEEAREDSEVTLIINLKDNELNGILEYCKELINTLHIEINETLEIEEIRSFSKQKDNINDFLENNQYINYKEYIIDQLDYNLRYL